VTSRDFTVTLDDFDVILNDFGLTLSYKVTSRSRHSNHLHRIDRDFDPFLKKRPIAPEPELSSALPTSAPNPSAPLPATVSIAVPSTPGSRDPSRSTWRDSA
jgi:hypothetical protein